MALESVMLINLRKGRRQPGRDALLLRDGRHPTPEDVQAITHVLSNGFSDVRGIYYELTNPAVPPHLIDVRYTVVETRQAMLVLEEAFRTLYPPIAAENAIENSVVLALLRQHITPPDED